jgi:ABC-type histidine transport system ATPase subunit
MSTSRYPVIDLRNASGGGEVLAGIDLTADAGLAVAQPGPGGAGQAGLMRINALLAPDAGRFRVAGRHGVRRASVALLAAHPQCWDMAPARACRRGR